MAENPNPPSEPGHVPPAYPPYQYDAPPPPQAAAPVKPTGGLPAFFARWKTFLVVGLITIFVVMSRNGTENLATNIQKKAVDQGPRISGPDLAEKQNALDRETARLKQRQDALAKVLACQQTGKCDPSVKASDGSASLPLNATHGEQQLSELQQARQQIAAEQERARYLSAWTSPIVSSKKQDVPYTLLAATQPEGVSQGQQAPTPSRDGHVSGNGDPNSTKFAYDSSTGPYHTILRGTPISTKLMNELTGDSGGPIVVQVDRGEQVYVKSTDRLLFPEGTQIIGSVIPVNSGNQRYLGVAFDRIIMPDGYSISLTSTPGLSQSGHSGIEGDVNNHVASKLGWSIAIGAIQGLSSGVFLGGVGNSGTTTILRQPAQDMSNLFQGILNRPPTVTVPIGTRVNIIMLEDLPNVPEWAHHTIRPGSI